MFFNFLFLSMILLMSLIFLLSLNRWTLYFHESLKWPTSLCNYSHLMWASMISHYTIAFQLYTFSQHTYVCIIHSLHNCLSTFTIFSLLVSSIYFSQYSQCPTHETISLHVSFYSYNSSNLSITINLMMSMLSITLPLPWVIKKKVWAWSYCILKW